MSTRKNIEFHKGATWQIFFNAHNPDNTVIPLVAGVEVNFRMNNGSTVLFDKTIGAGVVVTDEAAGAATITITPADQTAASIAKNKSYSYEIQCVQPALPRTSIQAEGTLKVLPSLFSP